MAYERTVAIAAFMALFVAGSVQAQTPAQAQCRKQCNASYDRCTKMRRADAETACRSAWHNCKKTKCEAQAVAPVRVTPVQTARR